ncbi:Paxillin-like protein 1 [Tolypocladium ophioglossoides CBS 100239]|uniref:Paxillin-like protein 1 n=1 Tax=Tolypocladium ophioglossoides (strain CBS 100239) TaxID=1163406 RepID=A0A0L0N7F4_TOLOC|nr:Paxillin-like protein 1 [Tolypocladium ophioglossoides CBS 100239]
MSTAMALPRESTFLPTIKCSSCGRQVEISMMGDHLCGGPTAELSPPPDANDEFDDHFNQSSYSKYGRTPPPVDTNAANRPFMNRGQLTPVSQPSGSRSVSPITPNGRPSPSRTDNYFAPFPGQARRPGGYGGFGEQAKEQAEPSLGKQGGGGLLERMNTIAPGPFDANKRPSAARNALPMRRDSLEKLDAPSMEELSRPTDQSGTSHSNVSGGGSTTMAPPRVPRKNGYGGFGPPSSIADELEPGTNGLVSRSETYPKPSAPPGPPARMPSAPGTRPDPSRNTGNFGHERKKSMGPDVSRRPPPRTSLLAQHRPKNSRSVDLAAEFGDGNPYHTPSGSASSGYSTFSHPSQASSQTSPARSQTHQNDLDPLPKVDKAMNEPQISMESLRPHDLRIDPTAQARRRTPSPLAESPRGISPREERYDPSMQAGQLDLPPRGYDRPLPFPRYGSSPQREPDYMRPERRNDHSQGRLGTSPPSRQETPRPLRTPSRDPMTLPSRGDCKACGLAIRGKSISSADGRLTGKYHKACFVCATCSEPFTSAEFYVLSDKPYCEQHYHKLNGSLCGGCGRGIEGQYLEDESRIKHHVGCFRCLDCGMSLSDGYFEVDGKSYCERDAWKRTQPPANGYGMAEQDAYSPPPPGPHRGGPGPRPGPGRGGLPDRPGPRPGPGGLGLPRPPYGAQYGSRLGPGVGPRPQMNKRMTRLGQM